MRPALGVLWNTGREGEERYIEGKRGREGGTGMRVRRRVSTGEEGRREGEGEEGW